MAMTRTQIYLTQQEQNALRAIARLKGASQSEVIREALDEFIAAYRETNWVDLLQAARGIWADREDLDLRAIRSEFDRAVEGQE